ncbi:MAG: hypothetical protein AB7P03_18425 [Kofleriaceae bacterium]
MKCIYCNRDSPYKDRTGGRCGTCRKPFAFEPKRGDPFTDVAFNNAIEAVSSAGTVRFLPAHVFYELARRARDRGAARGFCWALGGIAAVAAAFATPYLLAATAALGLLGVAIPPNPTIRLEQNVFHRLWDRWVEVHGVPKGLIVRKSQDGPYRGTHSDIPNYSFDRAVICDRADTVDVLLANNFHFENNCAVLSVDGYPPHAFPIVREMLRKNPRLTVYVLHDADPRGCTLAHRMANDPTWFKGQARVVEVGIRPAQIQKLKGVWAKASSPVDHPQLLTTLEQAWLGRYQLELAAIRPEQVIKRLFAAIVNDEKLVPADQYIADSGGDSSTYYIDETSMASDASAADGAGDAFG